MRKICLTKVFFIIILLASISLSKNETTAILIDEVRSILSNIQKIVRNDNYDSLYAFFHSDTVPYFTTSCPDPDTVGDLRKIVKGDIKYVELILGPFIKQHRAVTINPISKDTIEIGFCQTNQSFENQNLKFIRKKTDSGIRYVNEKPEKFGYGTGYSITMIIIRDKDGKLRIRSLKRNESC